MLGALDGALNGGLGGALDGALDSALDGEEVDKQIVQPERTAEESLTQLINEFSVTATLLGPVVPEYAVPATVNLSYEPSVLKLDALMVPATSTVISHCSLLAYGLLLLTQSTAAPDELEVQGPLTLK